MRDPLIPDAGRILDWIRRVYEQGVRRPGYPADRWAESFCAERFRELGLENVRLEPVRVLGWEPRSWSLQVCGASADTEIPCFPLPHSAPTEEVELQLSAFDSASPSPLGGSAALETMRLLRHAPAGPAGVSGGHPEGLPAAERVLDPRGTFEDAVQVLPFGPRIMAVMEPAIEAGAAAWIGALADYPGDSFEYYVPYDAVPRPIPGVWIRGSDGARLREMLAAGPVRIRLRVDSVSREITCHNVVGELPGADEEMVVIGSHHDGPWSSAVEDASGIALVLAQATYWSGLPAAERPHRLVFLLNAAHMAGSAGCQAFIQAHAAALERIVLELHLEHAACELEERGGRLVPSREPETRWFFTSCIPRLEKAVVEALRAEALDRSLVLPPEVFAPQPTTDGGAFHPAGVPLVNYLTAPFYLFDAMDTMDKIHEPSLVPVTRAAIRIVDATRGVSAAAMRADRYA